MYNAVTLFRLKNQTNSLQQPYFDVNGRRGLYVRLYDWRPKSVSAGLGCGLDCTPVLFVTHSVDEAAFAACVAL